MDILLTNDDGILAPGIAAMHAALQGLGTVHVVAPETAQSAAGHGITLTTPLICRQVHVAGKFDGWSVDGRPADCVKLALQELVPRRPQLLVSGINAGGNSGVNVLYSGTVAAAVEGALFSIPAVAFSLDTETDFDFRRAGAIARRVLDSILANGLYPGMLLNVNIPQLPEGRMPAGVRVVRQATDPWQDTFDRRTDPRGRLYFWLANGTRQPGAPQTDDEALADGYVAVTPLQFDLTDRNHLARLADWRWGLDGTPNAEQGAR
jgi:5'-nucleotidase